MPPGIVATRLTPAAVECRKKARIDTRHAESFNLLTPMKTILLRKNGLALLALALVAPFALRTALAIDEDKMEVKQAVTQFYSALNTMFKGELGPMKHIWSHAADVTYMGPAGGMQVGWPDVLAEWKKQAAMKLGGQVQPSDIHIIMGTNLAVVQDIEVGSNTNAAGQATTISIRATNVFRKEGEEWLMISHHTDLLPSMAK